MPKKPEKVKLVPFCCCNRCSNSRYHAACHEVSVPEFGVFVCSKHHDSFATTWQICKENRNPTLPSRICEKCYQKYHFNAFYVGKKDNFY